MANFYMRQSMPLILASLLDLKVGEAGCAGIGSVKGKN
jgi:hypothetical protein